MVLELVFEFLSKVLCFNFDVAVMAMLLWVISPIKISSRLDSVMLLVFCAAVCMVTFQQLHYVWKDQISKMCVV